jgi:hypothetical protein
MSLTETINEFLKVLKNLKNVENIEIFPSLLALGKFFNKICKLFKFSKIFKNNETLKEFSKVFGNFEKCRNYLNFSLGKFFNKI